MKFRTEINDFTIPIEVDYSTRMMFIGSCFAENIGERFAQNKFSASVNPLGILFNPVSIFKGLQSLIHSEVPDAKSTLLRDHIAYSWNHHSSLYNETQDGLIDEIHRINKSGNRALESANVLFITLGTAWAYRHLETKKIVANCHKKDASEFRKELLDSNDIVDEFQRVYESLMALNPELSIVFTVSPVRHVRDGLIENNQSKAELLKSVHQMVNRFTNCHYLPIYEWVIDDLRDYRYYEKDLVHPNHLAQDYLWEKMEALFLSPSTKDVLKKINRFNTGYNHRPFQESAAQHQTFLQKLFQLGQEIQTEAGVNLHYELNEIEERIQTL